MNGRQKVVIVFALLASLFTLFFPPHAGSHFPGHPIFLNVGNPDYGMMAVHLGIIAATAALLVVCISKATGD